MGVGSFTLHGVRAVRRVRPRGLSRGHSLPRRVLLARKTSRLEYERMRYSHLTDDQLKEKVNRKCLEILLCVCVCSACSTGIRLRWSLASPRSALPKCGADHHALTVGDSQVTRQLTCDNDPLVQGTWCGSTRKGQGGSL